MGVCYGSVSEFLTFIVVAMAANSDRNYNASRISAPAPSTTPLLELANVVPRLLGLEGVRVSERGKRPFQIEMYRKEVTQRGSQQVATLTIRQFNLTVPETASRSIQPGAGKNGSRPGRHPAQACPTIALPELLLRPSSR